MATPVFLALGAARVSQSPEELIQARFDALHETDGSSSDALSSWLVEAAELAAPHVVPRQWEEWSSSERVRFHAALASSFERGLRGRIGQVGERPHLKLLAKRGANRAVPEVLEYQLSGTEEALSFDVRLIPEQGGG